MRQVATTGEAYVGRRRDQLDDSAMINKKNWLVSNGFYYYNNTNNEAPEEIHRQLGSFIKAVKMGGNTLWKYNLSYK
ncbi:unnamed protein product [Pieris macdunnoughi]|uniref:Uncharacterized protein n=1 Tax=Pieris macdunnoughi TaxID=345717 RepID=A0A821SAV5_9NEOP|nr:unnamed protein product [Pieris macdunnoughi]